MSHSLSRLPRYALLAWLSFILTEVTDAYSAEKLRYRGRKYVFDSYKDLFSDKGVGRLRRVLFEKYLQYSDEGKKRTDKAGSRNPEAVWLTLAIEEKASFLAITAALGNVEAENRINLLEWIDSLEEIHGETRFSDGRRFMNNEAFRIYTKLQPAALAHIIQGSGQFKNLCTKRSFGYDGLGMRHPDFCRPTQQFEGQRSTDNHPHLHFNFTAMSRCVDVDIDYRKGLLHLTRDNSNVLAGENWRTFKKEYCDPGFRLD